MNAPRFFWVAATALIVIIAAILLFGHLDWDDDDDIGWASYTGRTTT